MAIAEGSIAQFAIGEFTVASDDAVVNVPVLVSEAAALAPFVGAGTGIAAGALVTTVDAPAPFVTGGASVAPAEAATEADAVAPIVGAGSGADSGVVETVAAPQAPAIGAGSGSAPAALETEVGAVAPFVAAGSGVALEPIETIVAAQPPAAPPGTVVEVPALVTVASAHAPFVATGSGARAVNLLVIADGATIGEFAIAEPAALATFEQPLETLFGVALPGSGGGAAIVFDALETEIAAVAPYVIARRERPLVSIFIG